MPILLTVLLAIVVLLLYQIALVERSPIDLENLSASISDLLAWLLQADASEGSREVYEPSVIFGALPLTLALASLGLGLGVCMGAFWALLGHKFSDRRWFAAGTRTLLFVSATPSILLIFISISIAYSLFNALGYLGMNSSLFQRWLVAVLVLAFGNGTAFDYYSTFTEEVDSLKQNTHYNLLRIGNLPFWPYALRSIVGPLLTKLLGSLVLFIGMVIPVEIFCNLPGIGTKAWHIVRAAIINNHGTLYPLIGVVVVIGCAVALLEGLNQLLRITLDPRQRDRYYAQSS